MQRHVSPHISVRHDGAVNQEVKVLSEQLSIQFGSYPGGGRGQLRQSKPWGQSSALGGVATVWAATRVNPEQASKVKSRMLTRLRYGEGRWVVGKRSIKAPAAILRGSGSGTYGRLIGQRGRPTGDEGRDLQRIVRMRSLWESERFIVPGKSGNADGGKGPHFWNAFEETKG